ncbi:MAG TPA: hypothetical protein VNF71_03260 [Acidimicrobiales bacterium]|nr:hypothetical protein [Acidimicrobiales bacterium]
MRSLAEIVSLRTPACDRVAAVLPAIAAGEEPVGVQLPAGIVASEHVSECLRCQAELSAYRRLLEHLRAMRHDEIAPHEGALPELLRAMAEQRFASTWAVKAAYVGGITVATAAAGAAGVLVWMSRRRLAPAS